MGRLLLIILSAISILFTVTNLSVQKSGVRLINTAAVQYRQQMVRNIAASGLELAMMKLQNDTAWSAGISNLSVGGGRLSVSITSSSGIRTVTSTGSMLTPEGTISKTLSVSMGVQAGFTGFMPVTVLAAITTNNPVQTLGGLVADGRDHDYNGNLIPQSGTLGIWTTCALSRGGNSKIGGTTASVDYAPAKSESNNTRLENQTYPGGYPSSPDSIIGGSANGYPPGRLKQIAQSGAGGSQYVTDPSALSYPLKGVTYVELPSGETWQSMNIEGTGILVVHNSSVNAKMKNLNSGTFKGLLIADDIIHIHTNIIGAVIGLSPSPSEGNCIGNGNGSVLFSRQALVQATAKALPASKSSTTRTVSMISKSWSE